MTVTMSEATFLAMQPKLTPAHLRAESARVEAEFGGREAMFRAFDRARARAQR